MSMFLKIRIDLFGNGIYLLITYIAQNVLTRMFLFIYRVTNVLVYRDSCKKTLIQ